MSFKVVVQPSHHEFTVADGQTVLDGALAAGVILPYSCRDGACSTCKGRVVAGTYDAGPCPARILPPEDLAADYTLFCQARPSSDLIIEAREIRMAGDIQIRKMPSRVMALDRVRDDVAIMSLQLPPASPLRYYPGQYLQFILADGRRRSYSMANPPADDNRVELHIRHTPGGVFTDRVFGVGATPLKVREILRMEGPFGSFFLRDDGDRPIIFVASGTGFAPIKAIVEQMMARHDARPVVLYWGGRRPADLYLHEKVAAWVDVLPDFRYVPVVSDAEPQDGWTGRVGFVHRAVMEDFPDLSVYCVYACGTPAMINAARRDFIRVCRLPEDAFFADAFISDADLAQAGR